MPPVLRFSLVVLLLALILTALHFLQPGPPSPTPPRLPPQGTHAFSPAAPPALLPPRLATLEFPALARERLLAADGSPAENVSRPQTSSNTVVLPGVELVG